jgi:hypothetical protein
MLDDIIYSKFPILASGTGSFPERLCGRRFTWIAPGCPSNEDWLTAITAIENGHQPWATKECSAPSYDFIDMEHALLVVKATVQRMNNGTVQKLYNVDPACVEFLALNPALVLKMNGMISCDIAHRELIENRDAYKLIDRTSLDETMFKDRNPGLRITKSVAPYNDENPDAIYNKLQWVSPVTLLLVWEHLSRHLEDWTYHIMAYKSSHFAAMNAKARHAALLIDPRYSEVTAAISINVLFHLGRQWDLHIHCNPDACQRLSKDLNQVRAH